MEKADWKVGCGQNKHIKIELQDQLEAYIREFLMDRKDLSGLQMATLMANRTGVLIMDLQLPLIL